MKRPRLKHEYHDALLRRLRFEDRRVVFEASLDPVWNNKCPENVELAFETVHNLDDVRRQFNVGNGQSIVTVSDEIIGVVKLEKTRYLVDLHNHGGIEIDCRGISEI